MNRSFIERAKRRLAAEAWVIDAIKRQPASQHARRWLEVRRARALMTKLGSADAALDHIVRQALTESRAPTDRTVTRPRNDQAGPTLPTLPTDRPLRVGVLAPLPVTGVEGGNERQWQSLVAALNDHGHDAELVGLVSPEGNLAEVLASYSAWHAMDLSHLDVVISGKYPAFVVRHPRHIRHLSHPLRGLYEHYPNDLPTELPADLAASLETCGSDIKTIIEWAQDQLEQRPQDPVMSFPGPFARAVVQRLDALGRDGMLAESTMSETIADRPSYTDPARSIAVIAPITEVQASPLAASDAIRRETRFFFTFGRMDNAKRFELVIDAFDLARRLPGMKDIELIVAGSGPLADDLAARSGPGVRFVGRLPDDELQQHMARAIAVVLAPINEDFGLVASESLAAGSPIITTTDSGGIAEQVTHGRTGLIVHPKPSLVAGAMRTLASDPARAERMGRSAADSVRGTTWQSMLDWIDEVADPVQRPRILMLSTFPASLVQSGGQRRVRGIAAGLRSDEWDVTILSLTNRISPNRIKRRRTSDGIKHVEVGRSQRHLAADFAMASLVGRPVDDIASSVLWPCTPAFVTELDAQVACADIVMLHHPFLTEALPETDLPIVYEAHNVESDLKQQIFADSAGSNWLTKRTAATEAAALAKADLVSATSSGDVARLAELGRPHSGGSSCVTPNPLADDLLAERTADEKSTARNRFHLDTGVADDGRPILVFIGSDHRPNRTAAARCVALAEARPDLHVVVAGSVTCSVGAATVLGKFANADLRRLLAMADVVLNPLEDGSGTSLKLIDALSVGVPVVSTVVGARGLDDPAAVVWLAEPDPCSLGRAVDAALTDEPSTRQRVAAGRAIAATAHPREAVRVLSETMRSMLGK